MKRTSLLILFVAAALVGSVRADDDMPLLAQKIKLTAGWNAVYLKVAPTVDPDVFFANWPVTEVGLYDPAGFTATKQFAAAANTEGVSATGMKVWRKGDSDASTLRRVFGNAIYLCRASAAYETTVYGVPEAMRITWHPVADTTAVLNYIGISLAPDATTAPVDGYFSGLDAGSTFKKYVYGTTSAQEPQLAPITATTVTDGAVLAMDATAASDWSGVLFVQPSLGVTFSTNLLTASVSVRNDGATARTVRLSMRAGDVPNLGTLLPVPRIVCRDTAGATGWTTNSLASEPLTRNLKAGETWTIALALDRTQFEGVAVGTVYGALLQFTDVDGGSGFQTTIPLSAISDGGETMRSAWPAGLWLCEATLTHVTQVVNDYDVLDVAEGSSALTKAGGAMRVRLPLHVDAAGNVHLVQRVAIVSHTNAAGKTECALYAGSAARPADAVEQFRLSSAVLPTDLAETLGEGTFGSELTFGFTVAETSNVNPFRHALHPNHDGLRTDFKTAAPSGDVLDNYQSTVKPELFSIGNEITLTWNANGATVWSPEEKLTGTCLWTFNNLRRQANLRARGAFTMQRIAQMPVLNP